MNQPERIAQKAIVSWLHEVLPAGSIIQAVPNEQKAQSKNAMSQARFHMARRSTGIVAGFPDLICLLPGGRCFFLELKRPPERSLVTGRELLGATSDAQESLHPRMRSIGHKVEIATCIDTARTALHRMGIETRETAGQPMPKARFRRSNYKPLPADPVPF